MAKPGPKPGFKHSLETRRKMSESKKGNKYGQGNKGNPLSLEHRRKISEAHLTGAYQNTPFYQTGESHVRYREDVRELKKYVVDDLREGMPLREASERYSCSTRHILTILDEHLDETGEDRSIYIRPRGPRKKS